MKSAHSRLTPRLALAAAALLVLAWSTPADACSVCGCGDPLLTSTDPAAITGTLRLQLDTEYLRVDAGTDGVPGSTDKLTQLSYRLNAVWRPDDAWSLSITLPFVQKKIVADDGTTRVTNSDLTGLGDVELGARFALWRSVEVGHRRMQELALGAGSSLPTGRKDARDAGALVDPHGQLGTGAWGPFAGLHYRLEVGDLSTFVSASYKLRTQASYFDGTRYKFGDAFLWSVHGQYRVASRVALDLGVDARHAKADRFTDVDGTVDPAVGNTGGTLLSLAPGVYVDAVTNVWLFARAQVPVVKDLKGDQNVLPSFTVGLQYQVK
jgi:hypothetical protein